MTLQTPPDQFKNAALAAQIFADQDVVPVKVDAHPLMYDVQDILANILDTDDIFGKGGGIRNNLIGHPIDEIDVILDVKKCIGIDPDNQDPEEMLRAIAIAIKLSGDFEDCDIPEITYVGDEPVLNVRAKLAYEDENGEDQIMDIDINLVAYDFDEKVLIQECSAPILSVMMDPDGNCWADPVFYEHLQAGIIVTDDPYQKQSFTKPGGKCEKYGWKCMGWDEAEEYLAARRERGQKYEM